MPYPAGCQRPDNPARRPRPAPGSRACQLELSGAASTVEEREKLVTVPVAGKRNFASVTAAGEAELSGAASTVEEREKLVTVVP